MSIFGYDIDLMNIFSRVRMKALIYTLVPLAGIVLVGATFMYGTKPPETLITPTEPVVIDDSITAIGTVVAKDQVDLAFTRPGIIASAPYDVSARVAKGTLLASLDAREASANLASAEGDLASAAAEVVKNAVSLRNAEEGIDTALAIAYANAEDAVTKRLDPLFSDDDRNPQLTFRTTDSQIENDLHTMRSSGNKILSAWQASIRTKDAASAKADLATIRSLLYRAQDAVRESLGLEDATITDYKTEITAGLVAVNRSIADLNAALQAVRAAEADRAVVVAKESRAQAGVRAARVALSESAIYAPFAGTVTARTFEPGEFAGAGQTVISLASDTSFEIETDIPEAYVSKIVAGHPVSILLDAYPDTPITGAIASLDPAGRSINDVVYYRMTVSIEGASKAALKSGLTANVTITP